MRHRWSKSSTYELLRSMDPARPEARPSATRTGTVPTPTKTSTTSTTRADLLHLAQTHPRASARLDEAQTTRAPLTQQRPDRPARQGRTRQGRAKSGRRGLTIASVVTALTLAGGTAYAATNGWEPVKQAWSQLTGAEGSYNAQTPDLVAEGTTSDGRRLQLWQADNSRGGDCVSVRVIGADAGLDSCGGGGQAQATTNVEVEPAETILGSATTWVIYGHLQTSDDASAVVLDVPGQAARFMPVDDESGYWVGTVDSADMNAATLRVVNESGDTLGQRSLNSWDENLTVTGS